MITENNPFVDLARKLVVRRGEIPHTLWLRANVAALYPESIKSRSYSSPNYISDLGLRSREDPQVFLRESMRKIGMDLSDYENRYSSQFFINQFENLVQSEHQMVQHFDVLVNFAGEWKQAQELSLGLWNGKIQLHNLALLTYMADTLSASDVHSGEIYDYLLEEIGDDSPVEAVLSRIRKAAWQIKRVNRVHEGMETLTENFRIIQNAQSDFLISDTDAMVLSSVTDNLKGLALWKNKKFDAAKKIIDSAYERIYNLDGQVATGRDEAQRILQQITINRIQIQLIRKELDEAEKSAKKYMEIIRSMHLGYKSEALSVLSYIQYVKGDYKRAIKVAEEALMYAVEEGAITQMRTLRDILIASYDQEGYEDKAKKMMEDMTGDLAGFRTVERISAIARVESGKDIAHEF